MTALSSDKPVPGLIYVEGKMRFPCKISFTENSVNLEVSAVFGEELLKLAKSRMIEHGDLNFTLPAGWPVHGPLPYDPRPTE